jgi:tRNA(Arg) A34 adenosine deaminase TadA
MSSDPDGIDLYRNERDAIVFLGLLSYMYLNWDPPIQAGPKITDVTHYHGLNICGVILDNADGEVLALAKNSIHAFNSPVEHGEQISLRMAIAKMQTKRPRSPSTTVEDYYRSQLFYAAGTDPKDFILQGCTMYTSLEPCPMCTATLCVCRMKRIIYVTEDQTYGGSYDWRTEPVHRGIKDKFYSAYDMSYGCLGLNGQLKGVTQKASSLYSRILAKIGRTKEDAGTLRAKGVYETMFFDHLHEDLEAISTCFSTLTPDDLVTQGDFRACNLRTLAELRQLCNTPMAMPATARTATATFT